MSGIGVTVQSSVFLHDDRSAGFYLDRGPSVGHLLVQSSVFQHDNRSPGFYLDRGPSVGHPSLGRDLDSPVSTQLSGACSFGSDLTVMENGPGPLQQAGNPDELREVTFGSFPGGCLPQSEAEFYDFECLPN